MSKRVRVKRRPLRCWLGRHHWLYHTHWSIEGERGMRVQYRCFYCDQLASERLAGLVTLPTHDLLRSEGGAP